MFQPTQPSLGVLKSVGGTAAPSYAITIWVDAFFTLTINSKIEVRIVLLFYAQHMLYSCGNVHVDFKLCRA
jgi:hypothetical protein